MSYAPITRDGVDAAAPLDFSEPPPPAFPRIVLRTVVQYDGYQFEVVFNDTAIGDAVAVLKRRGCVPVGQRNDVNGTSDDRSSEVRPSRKAAVSDTATIPPTCPTHNKPMRPMKFADKAGHTFMCPTKLDSGEWCSEKA